MSRTFKTTTFSCFVGIFVQAIVTNLTAVLFIPLMSLYGFSYAHLGMLVGINFTAQVAADIIFSGAIDKIGYRKLVLPATLLAFGGLIMFALSPTLFPGHVLIGFIISTVIFAFSSGLLEVLLSPIIAAIPGEKGPAMSLLHSFYAWGQAAAIILTTVFIFVFGRSNWQIVVFFWALVPLANFFMFLRAPFPDVLPEEHRQNFFEILFHPFFIFALLAIFFGAGSEVVMNQWASTFMEKGLGLPKLEGDLLGMTGFALMLGACRLLYGWFGAKINIHKALIAGSVFAAVCYVTVALSPFKALSVAASVACGFAVGLLWPGTLVISSNRFPMSGAWLFAYLAIAGDVGAGFAPWLTGGIVDNMMDSKAAGWISEMLGTSALQGSMRLAILASVVFPLASLAVHYVLYLMDKKTTNVGGHGYGEQTQD